MAKPEYQTAPRSSDKLPGGIPYIVGNEAAERFSFYGMKAILAVFMTKYLVDSSGAKDVMSDGDAKFYIHLFVASAYFFPILGAIISDWLWGKYKTILSLSLVYCAGHITLALDETRFGLTLGLTLIAIGAGGIKPCVSAHVGDQFGKENSHLLSKVFSWFYFSINLGAFASTLLTPILLRSYGPSVAFGIPGALMLLATWVFWLGRTKFVHVPAGGADFLKESFNSEGKRAIRNLAILYAFVAMFWALFDQTASAWVLQAESMDRNWLGVEWLSSQIGALNPILILCFIPLFTYVIYPAIDRVFPLTPLRKVAIGFFVTVPAFMLPAWIESEITGGRIVSFKSEKDQDSFQSTSAADAETWTARNLLDGKTDGTGWLSPSLMEKSDKGRKLKEKAFPVEAVIRLRERKEWNISSVKFHPVSDGKLVKEFLDATEKKKDEEDRKEVTDDDVKNCQVKEVEVFAGESRIGPWKSLGKIEVAESEASTELNFDSITTGYVMVRVLSNYGGEHVSLGEVEVLTAETMPTDAHGNAKAVWPNVAATGHKPSIVWQLLAYALMTAAEVMVSITFLEFSYTQAPKKMKSLIMSVYLLSVSAGNLLTAIVNKVIQNSDGTNRLPGASYYWFFSTMMFVTAVIFVFVARTYNGQSYIQDETEGDGPVTAGTDQMGVTVCVSCGTTVPKTDSHCGSCGEAAKHD
jgi:proton-dependent oligopeptide transporter, POT family